MKVLILVVALMTSTLCFGKSYTCEYENDGNDHKLSVSIDGGKASLNIQNKNYKDCKAEKDEFGTLVDCSAMELDLMVLVNDGSEGTSGGIMSSTFDLFVDLEC